jgi:hypothetical protein
VVWWICNSFSVSIEVKVGDFFFLANFFNLSSSACCCNWIASSSSSRIATVIWIKLLDQVRGLETRREGGIIPIPQTIVWIAISLIFDKKLFESFVYLVHVFRDNLRQGEGGSGWRYFCRKTNLYDVLSILRINIVAHGTHRKH